jgi:hypothetical protein
MAFDFFGTAAVRDASGSCKTRPVSGYSDGAMSDGLVSTTIQLASIWLKQA